MTNEPSSEVMELQARLAKVQAENERLAALVGVSAGRDGSGVTSSLLEANKRQRSELDDLRATLAKRDRWPDTERDLRAEIGRLKFEAEFAFQGVEARNGTIANLQKQLAQAQAELERKTEALERIASEDWRGNEPSHVRVARAALERKP